MTLNFFMIHFDGPELHKKLHNLREVDETISSISQPTQSEGLPIPENQRHSHGSPLKQCGYNVRKF